MWLTQRIWYNSNPHCSSLEGEVATVSTTMECRDCLDSASQNQSHCIYQNRSYSIFALNILIEVQAGVACSPFKVLDGAIAWCSIDWPVVLRVNVAAVRGISPLIGYNLPQQAAATWAVV